MRALPFFVALPAALALQAQPTVVKPYQPSPAASVSQDLGASTVKIDYSSPAVKGRKIWGGLVPYDHIWRAGANNATVFTFSDPVKIGGKELAAGSYAFFAVPGEKAWKLIFNRNPKQWGDYTHKDEEDVVSFEVKPMPMPHLQERLTYALAVKSDTALVATLAWEKVAVAFEIGLDAPGLYWAYLNRTLAGAKPDEYVPFLRGARYCLDSGTHLDQGLAWADQSIKAKETYGNLETKARLLHRTGRAAEALPLLKKALDLAVAAQVPQDYTDGLKKTLADWQGK
ncbi:DUF2911 domain-containing protein [Mesoterricola sediminis]|uniref:DUF2911 domain-containing protein n=1 Tax=Mesoterricola sediminis TaxID=2927980 RepID=A0AA48KCZ4_9BACT|nr:DUF2911 domain-containing protein [Mesoterricola sediminis]BDU77646.1 hypothetical protein METESE_26040 [Mesoterricola sediminis]